MAQSRRKFLKTSAAIGASAMLAGRADLAFGDEPLAGPAKLQQFGYGDVTLLEGPLREQFDRNHAFYRGLDEDALLKPYRQRAGLPAPGEDMGGWYSWEPLSDIDARPNNGFCPGHTFGQYVSELARYYAATGNKATQQKVHRLVSNFAPAITPHFWDDNRFPAYIYDKISVGMIDAHQFAEDPNAFRALDAALDSVKDACHPAAYRAISNTRGPIATSRSAGMNRTRYPKMHFLPGGAAPEAVIAISQFGSLPTIGTGIPLLPDRMCCPANMPIATSMP